MNFEDRINSKYHILNDTDKYIIKRFIILKPEWEDMTQQKLADLCNASTASIHRMLKKLDFSGFSEFKFYMIQTNSPKYSVNEGASYEDYIIEVIKNTLDLNSDTVFEDVYDSFKSAKSIYGFGTGTEQKQALHDFSNNLMYYDRPVIMLDSMTDINLMGLRMGVGDVVIVVSLSGNTPEVAEVIKLLRLKGIVFISITNNTNNAIAAASNINLYYADDSFHGLTSLHWPAITLKVLIDQLLHGYLKYIK